MPSVGLVVTEVRTLAGGSNGTIAAYADGAGQEAGFNFPFGVAVDSSSNIFVAERNRIRKVTPNGGMHAAHYLHVFIDVATVTLRFAFSFTMHPH